MTPQEQKNIRLLVEQDFCDPITKADRVIKIIEDREEKYIELLKFLRKQVTDSCCHTLLDEDDTVEEIDKILKDK